MISDSKRREVAERLRWLASKRETYKGVLGSDVLVPLRLLSVDYPGFMTPKSVTRLADLIDPTCEIIRPVSPDKFGVCSACGALVNMRDSVANATNYLKPLYCPNCGARVVGCHD